MAPGVLLDIDGVLVTSWRALEGAAACLAWLGGHRVDFWLVTNTSSTPRREIAARLRSVGMSIDEARILTAVSASASFLAEHYAGAGVFVVNEGDLSEDLTGVQVVGPAAADVVLLGGAGPHVTYRQLDDVFKLAARGAPVVALHRNTHFETAEGPTLDMGAFILGLESAAQTAVTVVGKPASGFFAAALARAGHPASDTVMVGDDIHSDIRGAQAAGLIGVLVRTGKFRPSDLETSGPDPDHVIDSIADLPDLLSALLG